MRYSIKNLYASAWESAIDNAAKKINVALGTDFNRSIDWYTIEVLAERMGLKFDENGNIL